MNEPIKSHTAPASEVEKWRSMAGRLGCALDSLLNRYTELVNCGDCGNWNPEDEMVVRRARYTLKEYTEL